MNEYNKRVLEEYFFEDTKTVSIMDKFDGTGLANTSKYSHMIVKYFTKIHTPALVAGP